MSVAFIDTETTGLHPVLNPVWDIAVIVDDVEHSWQVKLPRDLPVGDGLDVPHITEWVLENTRWRSVYDDDSAMHPRDSAHRFATLVAGRHLVGAVPSFDEERLRAMHIAYVSGVPAPTSFPWHYHLVDVEAMAVGYLAAKGIATPLPWKSHDLSAALGVVVPVEDEHTALGDARWAKLLYEAMVTA
jgi:DNA polymerase III epsilon subunit-like protein